jgi:transposase
MSLIVRGESVYTLFRCAWSRIAEFHIAVRATGTIVIQAWKVHGITFVEQCFSDDRMAYRKDKLDAERKTVATSAAAAAFMQRGPPHGTLDYPEIAPRMTRHSLCAILTDRDKTVHMTRNKQTIEVVTVSEERRRRWSPEEKAALVRETYEPGSSVSLVARKHGMSASQLFNWRKLEREGALTAVASGESVVPASELAAARAQIAQL